MSDDELEELRANWDRPDSVAAFDEKAFYANVMHFIHEAFGYEISVLNYDDTHLLMQYVMLFRYRVELPMHRAAPTGFAHFVLKWYDADTFGLADAELAEWTAVPVPDGFVPREP